MYFRPKNHSFQDFDLIVKDNEIYAVFVKKTPRLPNNPDSREPNVYALAKSSGGINWEEITDIIKPTPNSWEESIWAGSLIKNEDIYTIYYTGTTMAGRNNSCQIGKAYSKDLLTWHKDKNNPVFIFDPDNPYYSDEENLAFRDPFPFIYEDKKYILFCAKDKSRAKGKRGCVGIVEEIADNKFKWLPPIFSPGIYLDGLECPAIYKIEDKWYLFYGIDKENSGSHFLYSVSSSPFGPYKTPENNKLLPDNHYNFRIINFKGKKLLYHWFEDVKDGLVRTRLTSPHIIERLDNNLEISNPDFLLTP